MQAAYDQYLAERVEVYGQEKADQRPQTLMDIGHQRHQGHQKAGRACKNMDESEEINACSIHVPVAGGRSGGGLAAPCSRTRPTTTPPRSNPSAARPPASAAAIRDPLSGRAYVYQAMRITGCGDPRTPMSETIKGKLPQRKTAPRPPPRATPPTATRSAWPPAMVAEIYHPGYVAKHMELGAVVGAAPCRHCGAGKSPRPATWSSCWAAAPAVTASAAPPAPPRATT